MAAFVLGAGEPRAWSVRATAAGFPPAGGTIVGVATTKEATPPAIRATIDPAICGSVPDESVMVADGGQLANVIVSVPGVKASQPAEVAFANEQCRFVPRVGLMRPGGAVKMVSHDATLHTMHAAGEGRPGVFQRQPSGAERDAVAASGQSRAGDSFVQHSPVDAWIRAGN